MATVIDALLVTLGLDVSDYKKGQKDAGDSLEKFRKGAEENSKKVNEQTKIIAEGFRAVRNEILALVATAIGGKALKDFMADSTRANVELGRSARNLGMSASGLKAWQDAAVAAGGTAEGLTTSMQNLASAIELRNQGAPNEAITMLARLGVNFDEQDYGKLMLSIAEQMRKLPPQTQLFAAKGLGIDEGTLALLLRGRDGVAQLVAEMQKHTKYAGDSVDAARRLTMAWGMFANRMGDVGDRLYKVLAPALEATLKLVTALLDKILQFDEKTGGWVTSIMAAAISLIALGGALKTILTVGRAVVALAAGGAGAGVAAGAAGAGAAGAAGAGAAVASSSWLARFASAVAPWFRWGVGGAALFHSGELNAGEAEDLARRRAMGATIDGSGGRLPRGVRNNNPGNLEYRRQAGAVPEAGTGRFAAFSSMEEGFAALYRQLQLYQSRGIDTLEKIVAKYAPASENNVAAYVAALSKATGLGANDKVNLDDPKQVASLLKGIAQHENGAGYITDAQVTGGIKLGAAANANVAGRGQTNIRSETHIENLTVQTQATDAQGMAKDLPMALSQNSLVPDYMTGVN